MFLAQKVVVLLHCQHLLERVVPLSVIRQTFLRHGAWQFRARILFVPYRPTIFLTVLRLPLKQFPLQSRRI